MANLREILARRKQPQEGDRVSRIKNLLSGENPDYRDIGGELLNEIVDLNDQLKQYAEEVKKKDNDEEFEIELTAELLEALKGERGESIKGEQGEQGVAGKDGKDGRDGVDGKDGLPGKAGRDGIDGINGLDGKDGLPGKDGAQGRQGNAPRHEISNGSIRFENPDGTWGNWLRLRTETLGGGGDVVETEDLTSQCNGVTKTFTVTYNISKIISVSSTQFPIIYRPVTDYTFSGKILTLTSEVGAPQTGQTLVITYVR